MTATTSKAPAATLPMQGIPSSLNGSMAVSQAMRQTNPDVVAAYPITPSTIMVEKFSEYVANGEVDSEFLAVESEHSAMSACIGAAAAGARAQTVTSSQGLAFMWEALYVAAGLRLPIVLHSANRALSAPVSIHVDHSDTMGARDAGWIQLFAENAQEAYDNALMAVRIAEDTGVMLPVLATQDGYTVSHSVERLELLPDAAARQFVGTYRAARSLLDVHNPISIGNIVPPAYLFEVKRQVVEAMTNALDVIARIGQEYGRLSGRSYGLIEGYQLDDADVAVVLLGSTVGTTRVAVDMLRAQGIRAGLLKIRSFRPFPVDDVADALKNKAAVAVMDRSFSFGAAGGPLFQDVCATLRRKGVDIPLASYVYGIGGRDASPEELANVFQDMEQVADSGQSVESIRFLSLRE